MSKRTPNPQLSGAQDNLLSLQRIVGNRRTGQLLRSSTGRSEPAPAGLPVSRPADNHEQEADRIAQQLTHQASPVDSMAPPNGASEQPQSAGVDVDGWAGAGQPLPPSVRSHFESRFGRDLSQVRVHAGEQAAESAQALDASAYTVERNIVFGEGEYEPDTSSGKLLIAHELTHVIQQTQRGSSRLGSGFISQAPAPAAMTQRQPKEDWDFTPQDYGALIKAKGKLKIAADSFWFPAALQENLLNTLNVLLDPSRQPLATEGVNVKDFYHGHVVLSKAKNPKEIPKDLAEKITKFEGQQSELHKKALGGGKVTTENIKEFTKGEEAIRPLAADILNQAGKAKGLAVIYHTFELKAPSELAAKGKSLDNTDPRRNYYTPLDTNKPVSFKPPEPGNASSYLNWSWHVMEFSFLVDNKGEVHIRPGSTDELSTVTGQP